MSAVDLLEPILKGGLQRNNFFNGRLLSAEDLRAEQAATAAQLALLAEAVGDGVGWGLDVSVLSVDSGRPRVAVSRGLALNRLGNLLHLAEDAEVALVPAATPDEAATGLFVECSTPAPTGALSGEGAYVLTVTPTSGFSGTAMVSDPNATAVGRGACGARFTVEGVRFRLVPIPLVNLPGIGSTLRAQVLALLPPAGVPARERLRNLLAHLCLGTQALGFADTAVKTAVRPVLTEWGVLDAMRRRGDLTDCDVPLAVVVMTGTGIAFVDMWSARRRLVDAGAVDAWRGVASPRRLAEGEAAFLQFQEQIAVVRGEPSPGSIAASTYFDVLPAGGWLPTGIDGFNWSTFLGPHAPPVVTPVDAALLRGILERSWFDEPFALATNPPVPVRVYEVPQQATGESFIVFARSSQGNIRVTLTPAPASNQSVDVVATADTGAATRAAARQANGRFPIVEVGPGLQHVTVTAPDYTAVAPKDVTAIGGRTVDLAFALTPLPNGWITVDPVDKRSGQHLGERVKSLTASDSVNTFEGHLESGAWIVRDLPPGTYTITGTAQGYKTAQRSGVGPVVRGQSFDATLPFEAIDQPKDQPAKCHEIKESRRPPFRRATVCLVLAGTEFDERFYYKEVRSGALGAVDDTFRIPARARRSKREERYAAETGELVYSVEPWKDMAPLEPELPDVMEWLLQWQHWFARAFNDERVAKGKPWLYFSRDYHPARNVAEVPKRPPGYAVFTGFGVPLLVKPQEGKTRAPVKIRKEDLPGVPEEVVKDLFDVEIRYIDDIAWAWEELIVDATGESPQAARYLIADASTAVAPINEERRYIEGVDRTTDKAMRELNILDDVGLANADVDKLGDKLGSRGFALRLVEQARQAVAPESWSLESLGLQPSQVEVLNGHGIGSKGDLVAAATRSDGKAAIAEALGVDTQAAPVRDASIASLANQAVVVMARSSVEHTPERSLATWDGIDSMTAVSLGAANIVSVDDLADAKPEDVAGAAHITADAAKALVDSARTASRGSLAIGTVAPVSRADEKALKDAFGADLTVGAIAGKTVEEVAGALGGNTARATALLDGIKAGLAGARGRIG